MRTQYGKWRVLRFDGNYAICECSCGVRKRIYKYNLFSGRSQGCKSCAMRGNYLRKPRVITFRGKALTAREWAKRLGYSNAAAIHRRLNQMPIAKALQPSRVVKTITYKGIKLSLGQWAKILGTTTLGLSKRMERMPEEKVIPHMFERNPQRKRTYTLALNRFVNRIRQSVPGITAGLLRAA